MKTSKYDRMQNPPPLRLNQRDENIMQSIYRYGGFLAFRHLHALCFPGRSTRTAERRLSKLFHNGYLERPQLTHRQTKPIPESIYWLGWRGILFVAAHQGVEFALPAKATQFQRKRVKRDLMRQGLHWLSEPHWYQLAHDIRAIDVRSAFEKSISQTSGLKLTNHINEIEFRASPDKVKVNGSRKCRGVIPDFYLQLQQRQDGKKSKSAHLLFEIDMATRDNKRFEREKLSAYAEYIGSPSFRDRFSSDTGSWLIITTSKHRLSNLLRLIERLPENKGRHFYLTTIQMIEESSPLSSRIWTWSGSTSKVALVSDKTPTQSEERLIYMAG